MNLVVGIGLRTGTSYRELRDLVDAALAGLQPRDITQVVTVDGREVEPGLQRLVASLGASLFTATALELSQQLVPTPSDQVDQLAGTTSVAEAAVILSGAELLVPKQRSARATVAVGMLPKKQVPAHRATRSGVGWVSFFELGEVAAVLDLPGHVELVGYLCVGHVEEFAGAPELVRSGWAARRPLSGPCTRRLGGDAVCQARNLQQ